MIANIFILWVIYTGGGEGMDARPLLQFKTLDECLDYAAASMQTKDAKANIDRLEKLHINMSTLCLPAGVRP